MKARPGMLYVVATPIGNREDLSPRGREILSTVDVIAAEDTRHAGQLLTSLGIHARLVSLHEHNEARRADELIELLRAGQSVALVSDAGTPLISDPGYRFLAAARREGLPVSPVPGPCAAIATLSVAGLPNDRFFFEGFLPARTEARRGRLAELARRPESLIFYESVHRICPALADAVAVLGADRPATLGRELTKLHETIYRGSLAEILQSVEGDPAAQRGEYTLVVAGNAAVSAAGEEELARVVGILTAELPAAQAAGLAARITGGARRDAYRIAMKAREKPPASDE